eukprot:COSAG02_NODE_10958_length_1824_cov_10.888696_2_plen_206_part_00
MPDAVEWQRGAIEAWKLAAEEMAKAGKHAMISSQNSFNATTPYLMKEPKNGCPVSEDEAFAVMNSSALARRGWMRFYEYFAHPGDQHSTSQNALYCANSIKNAAKEASLGVPFVAAASDYPWGPAPSPAPVRACSHAVTISIAASDVSLELIDKVRACSTYCGRVPTAPLPLHAAISSRKLRAHHAASLTLARAIPSRPRPLGQR